MKQSIRPAIWLSLITIILAACGTANQAEDDVLQPLDRNQWPTPETSVNLTAPTPFPMVDEALTAAAKAKAEAQRTGQRSSPLRLLDSQDSGESQPDQIEARQVDVVDTDTTSADSAATPPDETETAEEISTAAIAAEDTSATEALPLVGTVASAALNVRNMPGPEADVLFVLNQDDALTVLETDLRPPWVKVQTQNGWQGWVNSRYLNFTGQRPSFAESESAASTTSTTLEEAGEATAAAVSRVVDTSQPTVERLLVQPRSGGDILVINRAGTNLQKISSGIDPALSPDGSQIAFTRWGGGDIGQLWIANSDGTGERMIMGGMRKVKSPSWSPDSRRIAINFQQGGTLEVIRDCHNLSSGEPDINFWQAYDIELEFSPEGFPVRICWKMPPDPHWRLRVIDLDTQAITELEAGQYAFAPTWDPANASRVVSVDRFGLVQTDVNQGVAMPLTNDGSDRGPVFSPDGKYIAVTYKQHDHWEVHRLNADGSGRIRLTKTPLYAVVDSPRQWNNASPVFSPDGTEIAFLTDRNNERWEVWVMNIDGSNQRPLFSDEVQAQLAILYEGNDARMLGWGQ